MCLLVFAWDCHPRYRFVFAGNRDEFHARPAEPAQWWEQHDLLAGRDVQAGGTWLGARSDGRFGVVTNFREMIPRRDDLRSRGELITDYMIADETFYTKLADRDEQYNGYNLIVGDLPAGRLRYQSNRGETRQVEPGLHGLSNHHLDTPWPKVIRAVENLQQQIDEPEIQTEALLGLLANRQRATPDELPDTGIGVELEALLSSAFIISPNYGTRCSTVILLDRNGLMQFVERRFAANGDRTGESRFEFQVA